MPEILILKIVGECSLASNEAQGKEQSNTLKTLTVVMVDFGQCVDFHPLDLLCVHIWQVVLNVLS